MEASYFWLISVTLESVAVALVQRSQPDQIIALGPDTEWSPDNPESFLHSVDISLSAAAEKANLPAESEPSDSAFVLPPKWIGSDGKINPESLKILENLCRSLKLKPLGFISNDEAFIEALNHDDSFPPSFILLSLGKNEFSLSLIYLGEVKKRIHQNLSGDFAPEDLENALVTLRLDSALPPRILLFGHTNQVIVEDLKNYPWVGKKDVETFLHLPDVEAFSGEDLFNLYLKSLATQVESPSVLSAPAPDIEPESPSPAFSEPEAELETELPSSDLGFAPPAAPAVETEAEAETEPRKIVLPRPSLPKLSLPKLPKLNFNPLWLLPLAFTPLLLLIPYLLTKAEVTLNFNPIEINKDLSVTLDSTIDAPTASTIPVNKKTLNLDFSENLPTTGQKETGDKAKGEITLFNKSDQLQNIPKGSLLTDTNKHQYELLTSVQIPASTVDLNTGTLVMGQSKANIEAGDIGEEQNIGKDVVLNLKDNASLIARTSSVITGGSRRQVRVVSAQDRTNLTKTVNDALEGKIKEKVDSETSLAGTLPGSLFIDKKQLDFSREVGEEADTLEVSAHLTLSLFQIDPNKKENIVKTLLADDKDFLDSVPSPSDFSFTFKATQNASQKSTGKLTVTGKTMPKLDTAELRRQLVKQKVATAYKILDALPRLYNRNIKISPAAFNLLKLMPSSSDKITIIQKF